MPASRANATQLASYAPGWNHTAGTPSSFALARAASVAAGGVMKLRAVCDGGDGRDARDAIVVYVLLLVVMSGVRGWIPVTGSWCAMYQAKTAAC